MIINETGSVAHYASLGKLAHILRDKHIKLGSINSLGDPRESSLDWIYITGYGSGESDDDRKKLDDARKIKEDVGDQLKIFCTADVKVLPQGGSLHENAIYGRPRMWSQYGDNSKGFCILLDKQKLTEKLLKITTKPEYLLKGNINYVAWLSIVQSSAEIAYGDGFDPSRIDVFNTINNNEMLKSIFFKKNIDWSGEEEFRWLLFNENKDDIFIPISDVIKGVVLGCKFPNDQELEVKGYCNSLKCPCYSLLYEHPKYEIKQL